MKSKKPNLQQVAAIPIRHTSAGALEVLLVTSRETRRWVIPKGWPWPKRADCDAAAAEAWEEAGVLGRIGPVSVGTFTYDKRANGKHRTLAVAVYVLEVEEEAEMWPEAPERRRQWFSPAVASELVDEPSLKTILLKLAGL